MRITCVGGGPGGLYFAILMKRLDPAHDIVVHERNAADDTFGFGVVFSKETLGTLRAADPPTSARLEDEFVTWDDIDIHYRGTVITSGGHAFAAISRKALLNILQARAVALGVDVRFHEEVSDVEALRRDCDLLVGADGVKSIVRDAFAGAFQPSLAIGRSKYMWLGAGRAFDAFKFVIEHTPHGPIHAHAYPYDATTSTFIAETDEATWRGCGLDALEHADLAAGENDEASIAFCERVFGEHLDGARFLGNNSRWLNFTTVRCERWSHEDVVLVGDAAHTAHFSIGSGTKLAMEDAIALAAAFAGNPDVESALTAYEARRPEVESLQRAAQASLEWFEDISAYLDLSPEQFGFSLLTRSRRVTYDNLRMRDDGYVAGVERWFRARVAASEGVEALTPRPPMFMPFTLRGLTLPNRVVVSPMDMYSADDGLVGDFHLVHLGSRALGGAGLVMTEMVCVSSEGRISPGCGGMYRPEHRDAWRRIVDFVHDRTAARIGLQLGHSGRKGSTRLMWEGADQPLPGGNWPLISASAVPYGPESQVPREMDRADMDAVREQFVRAARMGEEAGFDLLELHWAHGYLIASFISPLTNLRRDGYGGTLERRMRYPLEVFDAVRAVWPERKPMSVRISATDWAEGGLEVEEAIEVARMLRDHGCDVLDVSTGQTTPDARPAYGRSYQTPFADRIRNVAGIPTIAVGAISSADDVNSIVLAGRADLCALARPHLRDPHWTLRAALDQDYSGPGVEWPPQYLSGRALPPAARVRAPEPLAGAARSTT
jgi:anthraniloyl-CoA monooxygenase